MTLLPSNFTPLSNCAVFVLLKNSGKESNKDLKSMLFRVKYCGKIPHYRYVTITHLCENFAFLGQERQYYGVVDTKTPICVLYGTRNGALLLALQSSYTTLQLISNGQIVDLHTVINIPSTALEENRYCVYLCFEEIMTYEMVATLQCSDHNVSFPLIFNSISASKHDSVNTLHGRPRNKITRNVSEVIILSSEIHEFKESVLFQFDFGDGVVVINESQSGLTEARHYYLRPGTFNITSTALFKNDNFYMIGYIHKIKANITLVDDSRNYLEPKTIMSELNPDTQRVLSNDEEVTYKQVYDEILSHNQSERQAFVSINRRAVEPEDLQLNTTIQHDDDSPKVAKLSSCLGNFSVTAGQGNPVIAMKGQTLRAYLIFEVHNSNVFVQWYHNASVRAVSTSPNKKSYWSDFLLILATPVQITVQAFSLSNFACKAEGGIWIDIHEPFDKYSLNVTSKDRFLLMNTLVDINIKAIGMERFVIFYNISCDGEKLASVLRRPYAVASRYQTKFITAGKHYCESTAYIKGMPGILENFTAPGTNTTVRKYFSLKKPITIFKYDMKVNGTSVASSSKPYNRQTFLPVFENITIYCISDGYNTTFAFIVYPYQNDDARLTAKKHYIVGEWNATSKTVSANFTYSSNSSGLFTIELQADNVFSRKVSNITANFRKRITPFEIQLSYQKSRTLVLSDLASYYQNFRMLVQFNLTSHNGDFISYHWKIGAGFSKVTRTATLLHTFNNEIANKNVSVFAFNNLSSYSTSKLIYQDIRGLQARWSKNSFVFCIPAVIQIGGVAIGGRNTICNITSGSKTLYHDIARPRAARREMLACNSTFNLSSIGFYNFTVTMYNTVNMTQVQVRSIEGIESGSNPFKVSMTSSTSTVETDAVFITTGDFLCPLLRCNFDFGDGTNGTFQRVANGSSVRHRYRKKGRYKVSGMLKIYLLKTLMINH